MTDLESSDVLGQTLQSLNTSCTVTWSGIERAKWHVQAPQPSDMRSMFGYVNFKVVHPYLSIPFSSVL